MHAISLWTGIGADRLYIWMFNQICGVHHFGLARQDEIGGIALVALSKQPFSARQAFRREARKCFVVKFLLEIALDDSANFGVGGFHVL